MLIKMSYNWRSIYVLLQEYWFLLAHGEPKVLTDFVAAIQGELKFFCWMSSHSCVVSRKKATQVYCLCYSICYKSGQLEKLNFWPGLCVYIFCVCAESILKQDDKEYSELKMCTRTQHCFTPQSILSELSKTTVPFMFLWNDLMMLMCFCGPLLFERILNRSSLLNRVKRLC